MTQKSIINKRKKKVNLTSSNLKALGLLRNWKDNPQNQRKFLQIIDPIRDLYLEYVNNLHTHNRKFIHNCPKAETTQMFIDWQWIHAKEQIHAGEHYLGIERNEVPIHASTWINLEHVPSERSHLWRTICCGFCIYRMPTTGNSKEPGCRSCCPEIGVGMRGQDPNGKEYRVSSWANEKVMNLIVLKAAQICEYAKVIKLYTFNGWIVWFLPQ